MKYFTTVIRQIQKELSRNYENDKNNLCNIVILKNKLLLQYFRKVVYGIKGRGQSKINMTNRMCVRMHRKN